MYVKENAITPPLRHDWSGNQLSFSFQFIFSVDADSVLFGGIFPDCSQSLGSKDKFEKGLWDKSVVELFIHDLESSNYLEFNLSPTGAFWLASFSDYRVGEAELKFELKTEVSIVNNQILTSTRIPNALIEYKTWIFAQTAIVATYDEKKCYLVRKFGWNSSAKESLKCEADFHQKKLAESPNL